MSDIWLGVTCGVGAVVIIGVVAWIAGWMLLQALDALIYAGECASREVRRYAHHRAEGRRVRRA